MIFVTKEKVLWSPLTIGWGYIHPNHIIGIQLFILQESADSSCRHSGLQIVKMRHAQRGFDLDIVRFDRDIVRFDQGIFDWDIVRFDHKGHT